MKETHTSKRLLALLLSLAMVLSFFSATGITAGAQTATGTMGSCDWTLTDDGTLTIKAGELPDNVPYARQWSWYNYSGSIKKSCI